MSTLELENQQVPGVQEAADSAEAAKQAAVEAVAEASRANDNAERSIDVAEEATKVAKEATDRLEENIDKIEEAYTTANEAKEAVEVEKAQREADRDALQTNINLEVMARQQDRDNLQRNINTEVEARIKADKSLKDEIDIIADKSSSLENEVSTLKQKDADLENDITTLRADVTTADTALNERIDTVNNTITTQGNSEFVDNVEVEGDESTVSVTYTKKNVNGESTGASTPVELPVADATQAGVMNPAMYNSLQETAEKVDTLTNAVVAINDLPEEPTQEQLTSLWKEATGKTELINGAEIFDTTNNKQWTYYSNLGEWKPAAAGGSSVKIEQFTNTEAGIIKGSTNKYQLFAEANGTGSVNGLDALETSVSTNTSGIAQLKVDMETANNRTKNLPVQVVYNSSLTGYSADKVSPTMLGKNLQTGSDTVIPMEITGATTTKAGVMTAAQVEELSTATSNIESVKAKNTEQDTKISENTNKIAENTTQIQTVTDDVNGALGDVATIQADYLSKAGLLNRYTTDRDNAYSASFLKIKLDSDVVALGAGARYGNSCVAIGQNSIVSTGSTAIGVGAQASGGTARVALGSNAVSNLDNSVALGHSTRTSRTSEVSVGNPAATGSIPTTRFLANVTAGEKDTDAVNKKQMEDYVAGHGSVYSASLVEKTEGKVYTIPSSIPLSSAKMITIVGKVTTPQLDYSTTPVVATFTLPILSGFIYGPIHFEAQLMKDGYSGDASSRESELWSFQETWFLDESKKELSFDERYIMKIKGGYGSMDAAKMNITKATKHNSTTNITGLTIIVWV